MALDYMARHAVCPVDARPTVNSERRRVVGINPRPALRNDDAARGLLTHVQ